MNKLHQQNVPKHLRKSEIFSKLMFRRLDKFDEPIFGGEGGGLYTGGTYIRDVNWVTYLGGVYSWGRGVYIQGEGGGVLRVFYGMRV